MFTPLYEVSVVIRRVPLVNRWVSEKWELEAVEGDVGDPRVEDRSEERRVG